MFNKNIREAKEKGDYVRKVLPYMWVSDQQTALPENLILRPHTQDLLQQKFRQ